MARKRGLPSGKGKKALVPPVKGAPKGAPPPPAGPPPRAMRGRVAIALPVLKVAPARGRSLGPPPPGRTPPPRMMPPEGARMAPETPRAAPHEAPPPPPPPSARAPVMKQRGAPAAMARLRRGQVAF